MTPARYVLWTHESSDESPVDVVLPDGCRDVLIVESRGAGLEVQLTDWETQARTVRIERGTRITGYRLRPGGSVPASGLALIAADPDLVVQVIESEVSRDDELDEVIEALSRPFATVNGTAKNAGVSRRTLQRRFGDRGLQAPDCWRLLARARRAATTLPYRVPLSEIAATSGYSDQAHMTREFVRWFGRTPAQLRRVPATVQVLRQPGLGNWTGEHSSIR